MKTDSVNVVVAIIIFIITFGVYSQTSYSTVSFDESGIIAASIINYNCGTFDVSFVFLLFGRFIYIASLNSTFALFLLSPLLIALSIVLIYLSSVKIISLAAVEKCEKKSFLIYLASAIGALNCAFCGSIWYSAVRLSEQSLIVFFIPFILYLILLWFESPHKNKSIFLLIAISFTLGVAIGVHDIFILMTPFAALTLSLKLFKNKWEMNKQSVKYFLLMFFLPALAAMQLWGSETVSHPSYEYILRFESRFIIAMLSAAVLSIVILRKKLFMKGSVLLNIFAASCATYICILMFRGFAPRLLTSVINGGEFPVLLIIVLLAIILMLLSKILSSKEKRKIGFLVSVVVAFLVGVYMNMIPAAILSKDGNDFSGVQFFSSINNGSKLREASYLFKRRWSDAKESEIIYSKYSNDLDYLLNYQFDEMYSRHFVNNFIGYDRYSGGDKFALWGILGIIGIFGAVFIIKRNLEIGGALVLLFILLGYFLAFLINHQEPQTDGGENIYSGSFMIFSIFISAGIWAFLKKTPKHINVRFAAAPFTIIVINLFFLVYLKYDENYYYFYRKQNYLAYDYAYNLLQTCSDKSILFVNDEKEYYPLAYLQLVENFRRDVSVVNLKLLNNPYYVLKVKNGYFKNAKNIKISLADKTIENLRPIYWEPRKAFLPVPKKIYEKYNFISSGYEYEQLLYNLTPVYINYEFKGLRPQDIVLKHIIENNEWERDIYFSLIIPDKDKLGLGNYLQLEGLAEKLVPVKFKTEREAIASEKVKYLLFSDKENLSRQNRKFLYRSFSRKIHFERFSREVIDIYRNSFYRLAMHYLYERQDLVSSVKAIKEMEQTIPLEFVFPKYEMLSGIVDIYEAANENEEYERASALLEKLSWRKIKMNKWKIGELDPFVRLTKLYLKKGDLESARRTAKLRCELKSNDSSVIIKLDSMIKSY